MVKLENDSFFTYEKVGEFFQDEKWTHPRRCMESYVLILMLEGTAYIQEEGIPYELVPGDMIILEPGKEHGGYRESTGRTDFYWLVFRTDMELPFKVLKGADIFDIKYLFRHLLHIANTTGCFESMAEAAALLIFEELKKCSIGNGKGGALVHRIAEYIRINADKSLTVQGTAEYFGYSADHIGRLFKKYFHMNLNEYITSSKIKMAQELLLFTELSVKQIAYELGYDDVNTFIKFFSYHEGISPRVYRNRNYNIEMNNR